MRKADEGRTQIGSLEEKNTGRFLNEGSLLKSVKRGRVEIKEGGSQWYSGRSKRREKSLGHHWGERNCEGFLGSLSQEDDRRGRGIFRSFQGTPPLKRDKGREKMNQIRGPKRDS